MFDVDALPVLTFGIIVECVLSTGVIKWLLKLHTYVFIFFLLFFKITKNHDFLRFLVAARVFSNTDAATFLTYFTDVDIHPWKRPVNTNSVYWQLRFIHTESVYVRLRLSIEPGSILSATTPVDGRRCAWCERAGLLACVPCRRRRASTSVYVSRRASRRVDGRRRRRTLTSTNVDALGMNGPLVHWARR